MRINPAPKRLDPVAMQTGLMDPRRR